MINQIRIEVMPHMFNTTAKHPSIAKFAVFNKVTNAFLFHAYLYAEGDWWCVCDDDEMPRKTKAGNTWNCSTNDLRRTALNYISAQARRAKP